jgi:hypothetical protein
MSSLSDDHDARQPHRIESRNRGHSGCAARTASMFEEPHVAELASRLDEILSAVNIHRAPVLY